MDYREDIEYCAFMCVYDKLSTGLRNVLSRIAEVAVAKQLIHVRTLSEVNNNYLTLEDRTQRFLLALADRISTDRSAFGSFLKVLDDEYGVDYLAKTLRESYESKKAEYQKRKQKEAEEHQLSREQAVSAVRSPLRHRSFDNESFIRLLIPPTVHGKPNYLPLHENIPHFDSSYGYGDLRPGPRSEPAKKFIPSTESLFLNMNVGDASSSAEYTATTRRAMTPSSLSTTSTRGMEHYPKAFKKTESGLQMKLDFMNTAVDPLSSSQLSDNDLQPLLKSKSSQKFEMHNTNFSSEKSLSVSAAGSASLSAKLENLSLASSAEGRQGCGNDVKITSNFKVHDTSLNCSEKPCDPDHISSGQNTNLETSGHKPVDSLRKVNTKLVPDTSEHSLPQTDQQPAGCENKRDESGYSQAVAQGSSTFRTCFGVVESQQGSHCLSCGHPLLVRFSSEESTDSSQPSPEVDPVQVTERSPGEYHPLADSECSKKKERRRRCKQCELLKKESDAVREELAKVQELLKKDREHSNVQVNDLKEQLHRAELENYELSQILSNSELRHREAANTIHQLQAELQEMRKLTKIMEGEQAGLKQAYLSCSEKCKLLQVRLQRADSMQCQENVYVSDNVDTQLVNYGNSSGALTQIVHDKCHTSHFQGPLNGMHI